MDRLADLKLLRFLAVGVINTLVGTIIMFCLYNIIGCSYWVSSAANYIFTSILSYILNRRFTFRFQEKGLRSGVRFAVNIAVCYFIAYGVAKPLTIWILQGKSVYLQENMALLAGMCIFTGLNYLGQRFYVFGEVPMKETKNYDRWLESPYVSKEEKRILREMSDAERYEAFYRNVAFGTAGMRGIMGIGTNRINRYTIRMAAKGFARLLDDGASVAIAYDTRLHSAEFAEEAAQVLAAEGAEVYIFDRYSPVPLLSFAVRELGCDGGIVITASHNTREYNGFKVYDETGCQIKPALAEAIAENMRRLEDELAPPAADRTKGSITWIGDEIVEKFLTAAGSCGVSVSAEAAKELRILYTSLHGSGRDYVRRILTEAGFENMTLLEAQADFNGRFPTVKKPNPEEPEAFALAEAQALAEEADILIGTDPDCDRIGVGVRHRGRIAYLTGNQTGALLIDFLARKGNPLGKKLITTVVTGEMGPAVAASYGAGVIRTLTGFKYIGSEMNRMEEDAFLMGYEESYGYLAGLHARDKDGVSSALLICQMAADYKARNMTLIDALTQLYQRHGYYIDEQESFFFEGVEGIRRMARIMQALRGAGKDVFGEAETVSERKDYSEGIEGLPAADLLKSVFADGSWIAVRPSGTEPKIKFYYCIKDVDQDSARKRYERLRERVRTRMQEA